MIITKDNNLITFNIIYKNYRYLIMSFKLSLTLLINYLYINNILIDMLE